ncbi:MAG TPA: efflux RND transporter periplasmic adaptor subunit [Armatimonadota bacterium]|jgi:RND family efflux transporter MFP subunit
MKRWLAVLLPALVVLGLIGWRLKQKAADTAQQAQVRDMRKSAPVPVAVAPAVRRNIVATFDSIGNVEAPYNVRISPKTTGRLDYLVVREGDLVTAGEVLARIDPSEAEANVRQQQAQVAQARYRLAQARLTQNPANVSVRSQILQQQAALASASATFNQAQQNDVAQRASAAAGVQDAQGKLNSAAAGIENAQASVRSAQANLNNARSKYNRVHDLYKQGFISAQDVDDAQTAVQMQQGALDVANGQLTSSKAQRDSAQAQLHSAQQQALIAASKGAADIAAAKAQVQQAKATLATARANTAQTPAYQENLAALQAAVDAAVAQLHSAQAQLSDTVLRSPLSGSVTGRFADPGTMASPSQPLLSVQAIRQVYVTVAAPEDVSRRIFTGQPATVRVDAIPGKTFAAKVAQVNPAADPASRQFSVRLILDNAQGLLKPGMFARISIVTQRENNVVVVPREAVQSGRDGTTVTIIADDAAEIRKVTTNASDAAGIAISSGVEPGEKVVVMSASPLKDGQKVRVGGGKGRGRGQGGGRPGA